MRLLSPGALWWLTLGAIIILFYFLKLRRERRTVPSVLLWQRAVEELEANAPFKRLRRSLLLLLQLIALVALVLALARPLVTTRSIASGSTVIVIDTTASMNSRDEGGRSRLDRAKDIATEMIDALGGGDRAAIIESSCRVVVHGALTSDRAALRASLRGIEGTDAAGNLQDAVRLAEQLVKAEREATIVIISDGSGSDSTESPGARTTPQPQDSANTPTVRFVRVGNRSDNVGIIAMNYRTTETRASRELFALIANFEDRARSIPVELRIDGKLVDVRTVTVSPHDRSAMIFDSLPQTGGLAELKLTVDDDLESDDVAYAMLPDARRVRVGVSAANPFLLQALAVNPALSVSRIGEGDISRADFDCIVAEGVAAIRAIESGRPVVAINPSDAAGLWQSGAARDRPEVTSVERSHPVNRFLTYADLHLESSVARTVAPWLKPIVSSSSDGLIWAGSDGSRRTVIIGFDLAKSDLPLKVEFPILLTNSIGWLVDRESDPGERAVRVGQPVPISCSTATATVTSPTGDSQALEVRDGAASFADDLRAGLYQVKGSLPFAASLLSQSESDNAPRDSIRTEEGEVSARFETFRSEHETWRWATLFAISVLTLEWWVYHRRIA